MSKTDKTRPLDVRMMDPKDNAIGMAERHDHRKGVCTLPERNVKAERAAQENNNGHWTDCYYIWTYQGVNMCGCKMCTDAEPRREERRARRHQVKTQLRTNLKEINGYLEEIEDIEDLEDLELSESGKGPVVRFFH